MQWIKNQFNKSVPIIDRAIKWCVRTAFELLKLSALAFMVMHVIVAPFAIEVSLASIVVFAAYYVPRKCR